MRHRLQMGTIVSDANLQVKYLSGKRIGSIEEWFIAQLKPGDVFWFAGRSLELVRIKDMMVQVKKTIRRPGKFRRGWAAGCLSLLNYPISSGLKLMPFTMSDMTI